MEKDVKFNPSNYRGRNQVTVKTAYTGIRRLYTWNQSTKRYEPRKDGKRFVATVKLFGTQKEKHFEVLEDAKRWRLSGEGIKEEALHLPFVDVMDKFFDHIKTSVNPSTWKTYKNSSKHLSFFFKIPVCSINSYMVDQWLTRIKHQSYLQDQHKTRFTYDKELKVLKQVLKYYSEYLDESYVIPIKARHKKDSVIDVQRLREARNKNQDRYLTQEEQVRFLEGIYENCTDRIFYYLAFFQLLTGTRIGEACALSWSDLVLDEEILRISKTVHWGRGVGAETYIQPFTKTGQTRIIPIVQSLKALLLQMKKSRSYGLVFGDESGLPLKYRSIQYNFNKGFESARIKHRSTHILRHTYSTSFLTATRDHVSLSRLLGHQSTRQTEHYAKITNVLTNESVKAFGQDTEERLGKVLCFGTAAG